jgi:GNAT superfamily N-acetyltransferase
MIIFQLLDSRELLDRGFLILKELRTELTHEEFHSIYNEAHSRDGFNFIAALDNEQMIAIMGYRILFDFVHGKHLYIDDLVTSRAMRGRGVGAKLLKEAERIALNQGCKGLRLCTGISNDDGKRFYEREGWNCRAVAYKKKL